MAGVLRRELLCACVFIVLDIFSCAPITVTDDFNETSTSVIETAEKNNISSAAISTTLSPVETKLNDALGQIQISNHQIDSIQEKLSAMSDSVLRHWAIFRRVYTEIGAMLNLGTPEPRNTETVTSVTDTRSSDPGSKDWTLHTPSEDETEDRTEGNSTETVSQEEFNKPQSDQGFNRNHARDSGMGIPGGAGQIGEMSRQSGNSNTRRLGEWHMLPEDPGELPHRMFEPLTVEEFEVNSVENNSTEVLSNGNVVVNVGPAESSENDDNVTSMEGADISHELYDYYVYNTGYNGGPGLGGSHGNVGWNGQNYGTGSGWNGGPGGVGNNGQTGNNRGNIPQAGSGYGGNEGVGNYGQGRINGGNIMHTDPGFGGNGRQVGGNTGHNGQGYRSWGHSGGNTGYGGNMGNIGFRNGGVGHSGSSMANSGTTGGNFENTGGNAGYTGGNAGSSGGNNDNTGGSAGNRGGNAGSNGGNLGNTGGSEINSGGKAGHNGGNAGNRGGSAGNRGGNAGNTGGNAEHSGGNAGNRGGNTQNTSNGQLGTNSGNPGLGGNPNIGSGHSGTAGTGVGRLPHNLGVNEGHAGGTREQNGASGGIYNNNGQGIYNPEGMFNAGQGGRGQGYYGPRGYYGNSEYNQWENENEYEAEFEPDHEEERVFLGGYPNPQLFNMGRRPMANPGYFGSRNPNFAGNGYGYAWGPGGVGWMGWMNPYGRGGQFPGMNSGVPGTGWNSGRGLSGQGFGPGYPEGQRTGPGGQGTGIGGRGTGIGGGSLNNGENTSNNTGMNGEATNETLTAQENGGYKTVDGLLGETNETVVDWFEERNVTDQEGLNGRNETIDDMFGTANETAEDILAERNETFEEFLQNRNETIDEMIRELNETLEERLEEINETLQFEELFPYNGTIFKEPEINIENGNETYDAGETEFENVGNDLSGNNETDFEPYGGNVVTGESQFERYVDGTGLPANSSTSHMSSPIIQYEEEYMKPNTSSPVNSADPATNSNKTNTRTQPIDTANDPLLQPSNKGDNPTGSVPARNAVGDPLLSRKGDNPALQGGAGSDTVSVPDTKTQMTGSYYSIPIDRAGLQERKDSIYKSHKEKDNLRQRKSVSRNHHTAQADRKDKADNLLLWTPQYADVSPKDLETFRRVENHYDELDLDVPEVDATSKNTDPDTDGDVPNQEHNYEVDEKPRYKRHLNFPGHALNGRQFPFHKDQLSHVPSSKTHNPGGQHDKRYMQHAPVNSDSVSARPELARLEVSDSYDSMTSSESRGFDSFDSSQGMTSALSKESLQFISSDSHHLSSEQDLDRKGSRSSQSFMDSFDLDNSFDHDLSDDSGWWYRKGHYKLKEIDDQMKSIRTKLRSMMKKYVITNKLSGIKTSIASKINLYPKINEVLKAVVQSINPNKHSKAKSHEWKLP